MKSNIFNWYEMLIWNLFAKITYKHGYKYMTFFHKDGEGITAIIFDSIDRTYGGEN